jgi:hypothetical protein
VRGGRPLYALIGGVAYYRLGGLRRLDQVALFGEVHNRLRG